MYQWGVSKKMMRVSALIHETAWHSLEMLQEFEPKTYNRFVRRVPGAHTFNHAFDESGIVPRTLPFMFRDWKEYRDYLMEHICPTEDHETYVNRWKGQDGEEWYKVHVRELILNDTCGTVNGNQKYKEMSKVRLNGKYKQRNQEQFRSYMEGKNGD